MTKKKIDREGMSERIFALRNKLGLSQTQLGVMVGVHNATVSHWESGVYISPPNQKKLVRATNVNLHWLLTGEGGMFDPNNEEVAEPQIDERIRELREKLGLTIPQFAERLNVSPMTVRQWEYRKIVPSERQNQICRAYGANKDWLANGIGGIFNPDKIAGKFENCESAYDYALRHGCDEITSAIFERYLTLPKAERDQFKRFLVRESKNHKKKLPQSGERVAQNAKKARRALFRCAGLNLKKAS